MRYSPCETNYFECELTALNEYGQMDYEDCTADFEDGEFWMLMREEDFWMERELYDFYNFWEEYHSGSTDDYDWIDYNDYNHCEDRQVYGSCHDFQMLEGECQWQIFYNSCPENEVFMCTSEYVSEYGDLEVADCAEDFFDREFWMLFREEQWWFEDVNSQHFDLYMFFDMYHSEEHHDYDYEDDECYWREYMGTCQDFSFSAEDTCDWMMSWSECGGFICESNIMNEYGMFELRDCSADFDDIEFWEVMRQEQWWQQPDDQLWGFYMYWDEYHYGTDGDYYNDYCPMEPLQDGGECLDDIIDHLPMATECSYTETRNACTGDSIECFARIVVDNEVHEGSCEELEEKFDFPEDDHDDYHHDDYHHEDDYDHDDYHHDDDYCQWKDVSATCADFQMLEGDCAIHVSYNPCVTDNFECVITFPATNEYGLIEQEMCQEDFEDPEFWSLMRSEQFWQENPQHADFHMFWDMYHFDQHDDYNDYEDCEWREVFGDCQDW